ncbi:hypothetical protein M8J77_001407 [Diaphorina citri]|nr:hypothetical protein M8J77_001407 [Diaphorina citri]
MWGGNHENENGTQIENFLTNNDVILMNSNAPTHVNFSYGVLSSIDLTLCSRSIAEDFEWNIHDDLNSSDHFPIVIKLRNYDYSAGQNSSRIIWKFKTANWIDYQNEITFHDDSGEITDVNECLRKINTNILQAANKTIPKLDLKKCKRYVPWWCSEVKEAIDNRKKALKIFRRNPIPLNFIEFKRCRAIARKIVRKNQEKSWETFMLSIDKPVNTNDMWAQLKRMKGKRPYNPIAGLKNSNLQITTDKKEMSEILAGFYLQNSADTVYSDQFIAYKRRKANLTSPVNTEQEFYNLPFTYAELLSTFKNCKSAAAGVDGISYQLIIKLPEVALKRLLSLYNTIWRTGVVPELWNTALIIPILKPGKPSSDAENYRPISLLCCMNKIMEKMISKRLKWLIEDRQLVDTYQNGNRKQRSTMDNLVLLEQETITALQNHEYVIAVFLDINKFYDRISKVTVLEKLIEKNIGGPMFYYLDNFLSNPQIQVNIDGFLSSGRTLANGIRQGSSLSGDLSNIATSNLAKCIPRNVMHGMFVDDIILFMRNQNLSLIESTLQQTLDNIDQWSKANGFTFSPEKTFAVNFSRIRRSTNVYLSFQNHAVIFKETVKWLGIHLDSKWTFTTHIKETKAKTLKAMNMLKILGGRKKGLRRQTLMRLYHAYILPVLDYGSIVYGSARTKELDKLNVVHHTALRIVTGAFRTSPIVSLLAECGQPTLQVRRNIRCVNYISNVARNPNHPCYLLLFNDQLRINIRSERYPLNIRLRAEAMNDYKLEIRCVIKQQKEEPQWVLHQPKVTMLISSKKDEELPSEINNKYLEFKNDNMDKILCFTDGSKNNNFTGGAYSLNETIEQFQLNQIASIYTAELMAIDLCLNSILMYVQNNFCFKDFVICSDSKSSLQALKFNLNDSVLINKILLKIKEISSFGSQVSFLWIPSHVGIRENELVDRAARNAVNARLTNQYTSSDYKAHFKHIQFKRWEEIWRENAALGRQLRQIKTDVRKWKSSNRNIRQEEVVLCRLRIGHCLATHKHLLERKDPPACEFCGQTPVYLNHWLTECHPLANLRRQHKIGNSMRSILQDNVETIDRCMKFLYRTKLFAKI